MDRQTDRKIPLQTVIHNIMNQSSQISTVMANITPSDAEGLNLNAKAKVPGSLWGKDSSEDKVIFMDGELLCGVLDKSAFGASDFGLVHSVYEIYGADVAGRVSGV